MLAPRKQATAPPILPPSTIPISAPILEPVTCAWIQSAGEVFAPIKFNPPFWLALPREDPRFTDAVNLAEEGAQLDLIVDSSRALHIELIASFPPGSIMIDVGADVGLLALQLAALTWCVLAISWSLPMKFAVQKERSA